VGRRARPHPWWTPVRVVLALACLTMLLGMAQKTPCVRSQWTGEEYRYAALCYSDVPYLYTGRGFAERTVPYSETDERYRPMEYPVVIGYFAYGAALLTQALSGWPDVASRASLPEEDVFRAPGVADESHLYFEVTAVLLAGFGLLAAWFLAGTHRGRPWDAALFAAAPTLVLAALVNWDLIAVAAVAGALWAWSRDRPLLAGLLIGLGTATKLYPLFLLGALLVVCLRRRRIGAFLTATAAAVVSWTLLNLPPILYGFDQWARFWEFNDERGADLGSIWLIASQAGLDVTPEGINLASWIWFGAVCVAVLALGLLAPHTPRIPQLAFLVVVGFLVVNKVYSPQYVLWLLPLAVLARPRWRDLLVWQAGEAVYFVAVWFYLGSFTAPAASGGHDTAYWAAIVIRVGAQLWLAGMVVRDVLRPERDPVRADGTTDDPMEPESGQEMAVRSNDAVV